MRDLVVTSITGAEIRDGIAREAIQHGDIADQFHRAFYASKFTHNLTHWEGVPILKNPLDVWIYQEILHDLKPTLIVETGTAYGGSALFFARMLDRHGMGRVISIDIEPADTLPMHHPRILFLQGNSSTAPETLMTVSAIAKGHERVMVVLDSDHSKAHVLAELEAYAGFVTPGQFLVVEDTNINGRPVEQDWMGGPGPGDALDVWLPNHPEFVADQMAERFLMTFYPGGWLRRTS